MVVAPYEQKKRLENGGVSELDGGYQEMIPMDERGYLTCPKCGTKFYSAAARRALENAR
jgi:hypothetical protein